jgi:hypothetical protein
MNHQNKEMNDSIYIYIHTTNQIHLQERIKIAKKHTLCYKNFLKIKTYQNTKINTKEHNNRQNFNICIRNWDTNRGT